MYFHTLFGWGNTGRQQGPVAFYFDQTNPATPDFIDIFQVAQRRNLNPQLAGRFQQRNSFFHFYRPVVNS